MDLVKELLNWVGTPTMITRLMYRGWWEEAAVLYPTSLRAIKNSSAIVSEFTVF
jgi:hypothetical protein